MRYIVVYITIFSVCPQIQFFLYRPYVKMNFSCYPSSCLTTPRVQGSSLKTDEYLDPAQASLLSLGQSSGLVKKANSGEIGKFW